MTLRMLPPGGGDGDEPDDGLVDPNADRNALAAAMADKAMELASLLTTAQRRFVERWATHGNAREALLHAWPHLRGMKTRAINENLGLALANHNIRAYAQAIRGDAALSSGLTTRAVYLQLWEEATDEDNPGYVRVAALNALGAELRQSGMAALEGISPPDRKALGKGSGTPEATEPARANHLLQLLSTPIPVPKAKPG